MKYLEMMFLLFCMLGGPDRLHAVRLVAQASYCSGHGSRQAESGGAEIR